MPDFHIFQHRLESFEGSSDQKWPHTDSFMKATPESMANLGLFFDPIEKDPTSDRVTCYMCKAAISNWQPEDNPLDRHLAEYNECPLVILRSGLGGARSIINAKKKTFSGVWPISKDQNYLAMPPKLAQAGFYYFPMVGKPDNVRCPDCMMDFFGWNQEDDPVKVHIDVCPQCPYVIQQLINDGSTKSVASIDDKRRESSGEPVLRHKKLRRTEDRASMPALTSQKKSNGDDAEKSSSKVAKAASREKIKEKKEKDVAPVLSQTASSFVKSLGKAAENGDIDISEVLNPVIESIHDFSNNLEKELREVLGEAKTVEALNAKKKSLLATNDVILKDKEIALLKKQVATLQSKADRMDDAERKLEEKLEELEEVKQNLATYKEEARTLKTALSSATRKDPQLLRNSLISSCPPELRRCFYIGEYAIFQARTGVSSLDENLNLDLSKQDVSFLTMSDIPWPVSPTALCSDQITDVMVNSFLFTETSNEAGRELCEMLLSLFEESNVQEWIRFVTDKDREVVLKKAAEFRAVMSEISAQFTIA